MVRESEHHVFNSFSYEKVRENVTREKSCWTGVHNWSRLITKDDILMKVISGEKILDY